MSQPLTRHLGVSSSVLSAAESRTHDGIGIITGVDTVRWSTLLATIKSTFVWSHVRLSTVTSNHRGKKTCPAIEISPARYLADFAAGKEQQKLLLCLENRFCLWNWSHRKTRRVHVAGLRNSREIVRCSLQASSHCSLS